jgi:hypothetical protein
MEVFKNLFIMADKKKLLARGDPLPNSGPFTLYRGVAGAVGPVALAAFRGLEILRRQFGLLKGSWEQIIHWEWMLLEGSE